MEERERPRERVSEGDGEESWFEGANGDSEGYLKVGGRKRRFGVESKIFEIEGQRSKGGWSLLVEALREMESISGRQVRQKDKEIFWSPLRGKSFAEVVKQNHSIGEEVARVRVDNSALCVNLEKLAHCLVGCWNSTRGGGEDLRSWGTQMSKLWGFKGQFRLGQIGKWQGIVGIWAVIRS
ncbi:hypothetical protein CK203_020872 [Vitis vinifera]|uniref:DUF4283 domain-containing protein n=1 Tax=Vitis vinifera TaxID=29760 RepID=A0A438II54_VITVI|nr:hypothetical protein CK203_020872 [Vitis vinifera]